MFNFILKKATNGLKLLKNYIDNVNVKRIIISLILDGVYSEQKFKLNRHTKNFIDLQIDELMTQIYQKNFLKIS